MGGPVPPVFRLMYTLFRQGLCAYWLFAASGIGARYLNAKTRFNEALTASSFGVYLVHLDIAVLYAAAFAKVGWLSAWVKIPLAFALSAVSSYAVVIAFSTLPRRARTS